MKTVCFDLRALQMGHENRGIGMYIRNLLENIGGKDNNYIIYCFDSGNPLTKLGITFDHDYTLVQTPYVDRSIKKPSDFLNALRLIFHSFRPLKKIKPDVFVQFDFTLGNPRWRGTKTVTIGYDLIPLIMKNKYTPSIPYAWRNSPGKRLKIIAVLRTIYYKTFYWLSYGTYRRSNHVICISNEVMRSFRALLKIKKNKISYVHLAPALNKREKETIRPSLSIEKPYIFYIGGTDVRKRVNHIVAAFNIVRGRGLDIALVLAGNELSNPNDIPDTVLREAIASSSYKDDIHLVGFVNNSEKEYLYKNALAFVFATAYEGFGMPILEAMSLSCPVITYSNSSIAETSGNAGIMIKDGDYIGVAKAIIDIQSVVKRKKQINLGLKRTKQFDWSKTAAKTMSVICKI